MSKTFDLKEEMSDLFGNPLFDKVTVHQLPDPITVHYLVDGNGKTKKAEISYVIPHDKPKTYQKAIYAALRQAGNSQGNPRAKEDFDKDEMGMLMLKLAADTDVKLSVEDRNNIITACKAFSETEEYIQIKKLLDPGEEKDKK